MTHPPRTILALDPGLRDLGYAVLRGSRLVAGGVLPLRLLPPARRSRYAREAVRAWIASHRPVAIVLERTARHPVGSLHSLHLLARAVSRIAQNRGVTVATYPPQTVRKALTGSGWATKRETAQVIAARYPALQLYLTQDKRWKERYWLNYFDAIALALHHRTAR
jgi:Holliday junction resolvasome RuvABC endonuclease subunit